jgi:acyl-CoA reductase-like NAD-dependent aldehyde dehydrogenase
MSAKTYKMFLGGAFVRSESGRTMSFEGIHIPRASRKDLRDAVEAAAGAQAGWAGKSAFERSQIVYRISEMLSGRAAEFEGLLVAEGLEKAEALADVQAAVEAAVYWAGWADKYNQLLGSINPVAGPYWNVSQLEPQGTVVSLVPGAGGIAALLDAVLPALVAGNAVVALSEGHLLSRLTLAEVFAVSDVPAGALNLLSGRLEELGPVAAAHMGVKALDVSGLDAKDRAELADAGAENMKRVVAPEGHGPQRIAAFCEVKTVWHPVGV